MSAGASATTLRAWVRRVGLRGPGLDGWEASRAVLSGRAAAKDARTALPSPDMLPPAERRRAGRLLRVAVAAAAEAGGDEAAGLVAVFASSGGDGDNCHAICSALAAPAREVSPTRFMNSVHNAVAGCWSIAARCREPSTALCAHDGSFAAGLLEALAEVRTRGTPVLLVAADGDFPEPLRSVRPVPDLFATALLLAPAPTPDAIAVIDARLTQEPATPIEDPLLERWRASIPAARALPLLALLAKGGPGTRGCVIDYLDDLRVEATVTA